MGDDKPLTATQARALLADLWRVRSKLIDSRNQHINRPFYLWRPKLKKWVAGIDDALKVLDEARMALQLSIRPQETPNAD